MTTRFTIFFAESVREDFKAFRAYDRAVIFEAITTQLTHHPHVATRNRKLLRNLIPPFEAIPPIWQLRVGEFRIFYDVDEETQRVYVRAIRRKPAHHDTEGIL